MMKKRVYVSGYFKGNFGDDLFLNILINRYPHVNFYILSEKRKYFRWPDNLKIFNLSNRIYNKLFNIFMKYNFRIDSTIENLYYKWCDCAIKIGGSLFMEDVIPFENLAEEYHEKKYYIVGANVGPIYTEKYGKLVEEIFRNSCDVCLRDTDSYGAYSYVENVRMAPDIAFQSEFGVVEGKETKSVLISVIDLERINRCNNQKKSYYPFSEYEKNYYRSLIEYIVKERHSEGFQVRVVVFCERDGDGRYADSIKHKYDYVEIIRYNGDVEEIKNAFLEAQIVYATRFHAMIMGFCTNKVTIPIVYNQKMYNVMHDMGYENEYYDISKPQNGFDIKLDDYKKVDIEYAKKESEKHFQELDKVLRA